MSQPLKLELEKAFRLFADAMLEHPSKLTVTLTPDSRGRGCELAARPYSYHDKGKLIGGGAETHRAMQIVLSAVAYRRGQHCRYLILESQTQVKDDLPPFYEADDWKPEPAVKLLAEVCRLLFGADDVTIRAANDFDAGGTRLTVEADVVRSDATALLEWALNRLMHAVGNAQGRRLFVTLTSRQPQAA